MARIHTHSLSHIHMFYFIPSAFVHRYFYRANSAGQLHTLFHTYTRFLTITYLFCFIHRHSCGANHTGQIRHALSNAHFLTYAHIFIFIHMHSTRANHAGRIHTLCLTYTHFLTYMHSYVDFSHTHISSHTCIYLFMF